MCPEESKSTGSDSDEAESKTRPLDDLMAKRSKPFSDWKEEREYLRLKWGDQGRRIHPRPQVEKDEDDEADDEADEAAASCD